MPELTQLPAACVCTLQDRGRDGGCAAPPGQAARASAEGRQECPPGWTQGSSTCECGCRHVLRAPHSCRMEWCRIVIRVMSPRPGLFPLRRPIPGLRLMQTPCGQAHKPGTGNFQSQASSRVCRLGRCVNPDIRMLVLWLAPGGSGRARQGRALAGTRRDRVARLEGSTYIGV